MKKYELTGETIDCCGHTLHRIRALRDIGGVCRGDLGGFVESEANLAHDGDAWIYDNAFVFGNALIFDNAKVIGNARICGNAMVFNHAIICGNAEVCENAEIFGCARVGGNTKVYDAAKVFGNAFTHDDAQIFGNAQVFGNAQLFDDAKVCNTKDYIVFKNWWSSGRYFTWTRSNNKWKVGCFYGAGEELIAKAYEDSEESGREYERVVKYVESILAEGLEGAK